MCHRIRNGTEKLANCGETEVSLRRRTRPRTAALRLLPGRADVFGTSPAPIAWPNGKQFAFSVFDDPDAQTCEQGRAVYGLLAELGFRTTRGVWPAPAIRTPNSDGETCANVAYRRHTLELQAHGFEVGFHNATKHAMAAHLVGNMIQVHLLPSSKILRDTL